VLLGPRRVGKTVLIKQLIAEAIQEGLAPTSVLYVSVDAPVYSGKSLEDLCSLVPEQAKGSRRLIVFDEIQYLQGWEVHLKDLVDNHPSTKFIATGSAAAALRLKSQESGAGRFSDFMLPPLTFHEFLQFTGDDSRLVRPSPSKSTEYICDDIAALNAAFVNYLNYGGYPEAVLSEAVRGNPDQFIRNDIVDKVLLKDLPSLYGIHDIQGLNQLFSFLAYNAGNEASLEGIAQESGLAKPTIKKYIEYLESAFLILKVSTVDENCRNVKRERNFKVYLNNPSMRAALFGPVDQGDSETIGHLAESAIFSQWQHHKDFRRLRYARWRNEGEVDIVYLRQEDEKPLWVVEIKWSDRVVDHEMPVTRSMRHLLQKHSTIVQGVLTSKTIERELSGEAYRIPINIIPCARYCYTVGRNVTARLDRAVAPVAASSTQKV